MSFVYEPLPGGDLLLEYLQLVQERSADMAPAWAAIVESFHAIEKERFDSNGPGWAPLADATVVNRLRHGSNPDQILQDTGVMFASLMGGTNSFERMTPDMLEIGTTDPKAHLHQNGGSRLHASGAGWPPQRKVVDLDEKTAFEWGGIVGGWIFHGLEADTASL